MSLCLFLDASHLFLICLSPLLWLLHAFHTFSGTSCPRLRSTTICLTWWRACWSTSPRSGWPWPPPYDTRSLPLCPPVTKPPPRAGRAAGTSADDACLPHLRLHPTHTPACVQELKVELGIVFFPVNVFKRSDRRWCDDVGWATLSLNAHMELLTIGGEAGVGDFFFFPVFLFLFV